MDRPPLKALPGIIGKKASGILVGVGKGAVEQILERNYRGSSEELLQTEGKRRLIAAAKLIGLGSLRLFVADEEDRKEAVGELLDIFLHTVWVKQSSQSLPDTHDRVVVAREVAANVPALALTELKSELGKVHVATQPDVKEAHELSCPNIKGQPMVVTTLAEAVAEGHEWCQLCLASVGATMASAKLLWAASTPASAVVNNAAASQPVAPQPTAPQATTPAPAAAPTPAPTPTIATPVAPAAAPAAAPTVTPAPAPATPVVRDKKQEHLRKTAKFLEEVADKTWEPINERAAKAAKQAKAAKAAKTAKK